MRDITIRPMGSTDVEAAIRLVMRVFDEFVAPDCTPQGVASFVEWANVEALAGRIREGSVAFVTADGERIVGLIEWLPPAHLAMLFVDPEMQGAGIGRRLFETALNRILVIQPDLQAVSVHASRYAVPFYRRLGFRETDVEREENGIRYTPMRLGLQGLSR